MSPTGRSSIVSLFLEVCSRYYKDLYVSSDHGQLNSSEPIGGISNRWVKAHMRAKLQRPEDCRVLPASDASLERHHAVYPIKCAVVQAAYLWP